MIAHEDLKNRFMHHPPQNLTQTLTYENTRGILLDVAEYLVNNTPASREQSLAITKLEEAMFWANAAVARDPEFGED